MGFNKLLGSCASWPYSDLATRLSRFKLVNRLALLALGAAGLFGINSLFFFFAQKRLTDIASSAEEAQAFYQSVLLDQAIFSQEIINNNDRCVRYFPSECVEFLAALITLRNRNEDYLAVLTKTFAHSNISRPKNEIKITSDLINLIATESFGLTFDAARSASIRSADEYIKFTTKTNSADPSKFIPLGSQLVLQQELLFKEISAFASEQTKRTSSLQHLQSMVSILYWALVIVEIFVYCLVGGVNIWKITSESEYYRSGNLRKIPTLRFSYFVHISPFLAFAAALISIILGQAVLLIENKAIVTSHCRKLNLQNIFISNRLSSEVLFNPADSDSIDLVLPNYCNLLLTPANYEFVSDKLALETDRDGREVLIRVYADSFSQIELQDAQKQRSLILGFLVFNVLALAMESLKLCSDSDETDDDPLQGVRE